MSLPERYILMLEDDPDDRYLTHSIMEELNIDTPIVFLSHTNQLFTQLEKRAPFLILMDFNLNPETGLEVLKKIRKHPAYQHIPVVLLGDASSPDFVAACYRHGANSYAIKPATLEATKNKIGLFFKYWLEVAETLSPVSPVENKSTE